jgi:hypothetical protein
MNAAAARQAAHIQAKAAELAAAVEKPAGARSPLDIAADIFRAVTPAKGEGYILAICTGKDRLQTMFECGGPRTMRDLHRMVRDAAGAP